MGAHRGRISAVGTLALPALLSNMRIHHLNCISGCPLGGHLMDGHSHGLRGRLSCHCLLVETDDQLILIDTGFGLRDVAAPRTRLSHFFLALTSPEFREEMTAIRQIEQLGFNPRDVRHIVLSHLDFDHAGGLDDFPHATVHLLFDEREAALARKTPLDKMRYRPQQWSTQQQWVTYNADGERWHGFARVRQLEGLPPEILLLPLYGHTLGHAAIVIEGVGMSDLGGNGSANAGAGATGGALLYAADAYFYHREMDLAEPYCTPGLRFYQTLMEKNRRARLENQQRLRDLKRTSGSEIEIFCAHDVTEFERLSGRELGQPARR